MVRKSETGKRVIIESIQGISQLDVSQLHEMIHSLTLVLKDLNPWPELSYLSPIECATELSKYQREVFTLTDENALLQEELEKLDLKYKELLDKHYWIQVELLNLKAKSTHKS